MKCKQCGNDLNMNEKFCGKCGAKAVQAKEAMPIPDLSQMSGINSVSKAHMKAGKSRKLPIIIGIIAGIAALIILIIGIRIIVNKSFSPIGIWESSDTQIQFRFKKGGELQVRESDGNFIGGLRWADEGEYTYYISGEMPKTADTESGEIGGYAYYDSEEKTLNIEIDDDVFVFKKMR